MEQLRKQADIGRVIAYCFNLLIAPALTLLFGITLLLVILLSRFFAGSFLTRVRSLPSVGERGVRRGRCLLAGVAGQYRHVHIAV